MTPMGFFSAWLLQTYTRVDVVLVQHCDDIAHRCLR